MQPYFLLSPPLEVECPECNAVCGIKVEERGLREGMATEFKAGCKCGCTFTFDVYADVMNKEAQK